jgi:ferredoxin
VYATNEFYSIATEIHGAGSNQPNKAMPDPNNKTPRNSDGPYYVDDTCIDCDMCRSVAPRIFFRDDETGYSYVQRQPVTPAEIAEAEEARLACPTESIGNDGVFHTLVDSEPADTPAWDAGASLPSA